MVSRGLVDFNHYDMKFLRDLKVLNESWYKQYLLSRTSETGPIVSEEVVDDDQDQQEFKFRSSSEDDFDPDAFNRLFQSPDTQSQMSEQRKQAYLYESIDEICLFFKEILEKRLRNERIKWILQFRKHRVKKINFNFHSISMNYGNKNQ